MTEILTLDAKPGIGKTYQIIHFAVKQAQLGNKIVIVTPSLNTTDQTYNDISAVSNGSIKLTKITSRNAEPVKEIINHTMTTTAAGEILLITHSAFFMIDPSKWNNRTNWNVIIDEVPKICHDLTKNIPNHIADVKSRLQQVTDSTANYVEVIPNSLSHKHFDDLAKNIKRDEMDKVVQPMANAFVSDRILSYVNRKQLYSDDGEQLIVFSVMTPTFIDEFKSVTIAGSVVNNSLTINIWKNFVDITPHPLQAIIDKSTRTITGWQATIKYYTDDKWTGELKDSIINGRSVLQTIINDIPNQITDKAIHIANKVDKHKIPNSTYIGHLSHGQNHWQHINNVICLSALNRRPSEYNFLYTVFDIDGESVTESNMYETYHQTIMRTSIRDPHSTSPVTIIVPNKAAAEYMNKLYPEMKMEMVTLLPTEIKQKVGRPKKEKTLSQVERNRRYKAKKRAERKSKRN